MMGEFTWSVPTTQTVPCSLVFRDECLGPVQLQPGVQL